MLAQTISELKTFKTPGPEVFNFRAGALKSRSSILLLAGLDKLERDETAHCAVLAWNGSEPWRGKLLDWSATSLCEISKPGQAFVVVSMDGDFATVSEEQITEGRLIDGTIGGVSEVGGIAYAYGTRGKVLRYDGDEHWTPLSGNGDNRAWVSAAGYSANEVYFAGSKGALGVTAQDGIAEIHGPTNLAFTGIECCSDGYVYACGIDGLIVRGRESNWVVVDQDLTKEIFWDIHEFQGRIFLSTVRFLYELKGESLELVKFDDDFPSSYHKLTSISDELLLSVGKNDVFLFDGSTWDRLI